MGAAGTVLAVQPAHLSGAGELGNESGLHAMVERITDLAHFVTRSLVARLMDAAKLRSAMATVKWNISEIRSQHSRNVDDLTSDLHIVGSQLRLVESRLPRAAGRRQRSAPAMSTA